MTTDDKIWHLERIADLHAFVDAQEAQGVYKIAWTDAVKVLDAYSTRANYRLLPTFEPCITHFKSVFEPNDWAALLSIL